MLNFHLDNLLHRFLNIFFLYLVTDRVQLHLLYLQWLWLDQLALLVNSLLQFLSLAIVFSRLLLLVVVVLKWAIRVVTALIQVDLIWPRTVSTAHLYFRQRYTSFFYCLLELFDSLLVSTLLFILSLFKSVNFILKLNDRLIALVESGSQSNHDVSLLQ